MKRLLLAACVSAAFLAGCSHDFVAEKKQWLSNTYAGSPWEKEDRIGERALIAAHPDVARRESETLVILHDGKTLLSLTPVATPEDDIACDSVVLGKVLMLWNPDTKRREPVAAVVCHFGEFDTTFLVLWDGSVVRASYPSASPDGHLLVTGRDGLFGAPDSALTLSSWPDRTPLYRFTPACRLTKWDSNTSFYAYCEFDPTVRANSAPFDAVLDNDTRYFYVHTHLMDNGTWHMESTRYGVADPKEELVSLSPPAEPNSAWLYQGDIDFAAEPLTTSAP